MYESVQTMEIKPQNGTLFRYADLDGKSFFCTHVLKLQLQAFSDIY